MVLWRSSWEVADPGRPERSGRIAHGLPTASSGRRPTISPQEDVARVPTQTDATADRSSRAAPWSTSSGPRRWVRTASPGSPADRSHALLGRLGLGPARDRASTSATASTSSST